MPGKPDQCDPSPESNKESIVPRMVDEIQSTATVHCLWRVQARAAI